MGLVDVCRATTIAALLCGYQGFSPSPAGAEARGGDDPVVSWGVTGLSDWSVAMPLLDIARVMRPFFAFAPDEWESMSHASLIEGGHIDGDGYPLRIPPGMEGIRTIWDWPDDQGAATRKGLYILTYDGRATIKLSGGAQTVNARPGLIIFENATGTSFWLDITSIDPGDPIQAMSIVRADDAELVAAGAMFDPDWLAIVADGRELRFMEWMHVNSEVAAAIWADRPRPSDATWSVNGAPVEVMVRLANEAGIDPWFNMPYAADEAYVLAFASYVRDHLDPRLKAHVEYSNEIWNSAFEQFHWLRDEAIADWGSGISEDWDAIFSYHTKRATEVALLWEKVFAEEAPDRLINIAGTQTGNLWLSEINLTAPEWARHEPDTFVSPTEVFEELAATTYFGTALVSDPALRAEMLTRAGSMGRGTFSWLYEQLAQKSDVEDSIPVVLERLTALREQANSFGIRLVVYEGGQHVHHSFAVDGLTDDEAEAQSSFLAEFVRSPEMGALYAQLWDGWSEIGQGPSMQLSEISVPRRYGSWGLLAYMGDRTLRSSFILDRQAEGGSWWGEGGGPQYLRGVTAGGSEGADRMQGTDEEDFLAGRGGADRFVATPGADGIAGGDGSDTYVLPGSGADFDIAPEGAGWRVTGPLGTAYLVGIETLEFGDGTTRPLAGPVE